MFDHVQIKVRDLKKSRAFYKAAMDALGYKIIFEIKGIVVGFGTSPHDMFEIRKANKTVPL